MIKKLLFSTAIICFSFLSFGQCDPLSHDWAGATFGVSPDPQIGEQFGNAVVNEPYTEVIYIKSPTSAMDIDATLPAFVLIDSLRLDDLLVNTGVSFVGLNEIGLYLGCNNLGDCLDPCTFLPGNVYCGDIYGTPTVAGEFPVKIAATGFLDFFGPQAVPYEFEGYVLVITGGIVSVVEAPAMVQSLTVELNTPNPAVDFTQIAFDLAISGDVELSVINLVGGQVISKRINGKKGMNTYRLDTSGIESGVYLYSLSAGEKKFTRRMIVQH